jgi:hypothetical protein
VIGLRLFPNPDFDKEAEAKWNSKAFYEDRHYRNNPDLERPFRVRLACAICHVAAHPLNPPADPAEPEWENLSAIIGNLNFRPAEVFGNEAHPTNFLNQFLASQQPGTVDTSMTSTDWVANFTAMNPVFEFQARINRSLENPPEKQPERAMDLPQLFKEGKDPRKFPRVLMDGADSVGARASLARVYLNIGVFGEQWNNVQNTVIGFTPRRPFRLDTLHTNSVNWNLQRAVFQPPAGPRWRQGASFQARGDLRQGQDFHRKQYPGDASQECPGGWQAVRRASRPGQQAHAAR